MSWNGIWQTKSAVLRHPLGSAWPSEGGTETDPLESILDIAGNSGYAWVYLRGVLTMDTKRNYANIARRVIDSEDDGEKAAACAMLI